MTHLYHATPYDISAQGFYFSDYESYEEQAAKHRNAYGELVEEYEIQFIDGDNHQLFKALSVNQATLKQWFDELEELEGLDYCKAVYLSEEGYSAEQILERMDDVMIYEGEATDYAYELLEETGMLNEIPESLRFYFDIEAFARDLLLNGDISAFELDGSHYVASYS